MRRKMGKNKRDPELDGPIVDPQHRVHHKMRDSLAMDERDAAPLDKVLRDGQFFTNQSPLHDDGSEDEEAYPVRGKAKKSKSIRFGKN